MIKVVYYYNKEKRECPVKTYLFKHCSKNINLLIDINRKIEYVSNNNGRSDGAISKSLHGYNFFEIRKRKDSKTLIRICYFCRNNMMVLLHAFEKSDNYDTERARGEVDKHYKISEIFKNNFIKEPKSYENKE
jgi:phage-related protein